MALMSIGVGLAACGTSQVRVPNLIGAHEAAAASTVRRLGFTVNIVDQTHATPSHPTPPRTVVSESPPAGTMVHRGHKLILVVYLASCTRAAPCVRNVSGA